MTEIIFPAIDICYETPDLRDGILYELSVIGERPNKKTRKFIRNFTERLVADFGIYMSEEEQQRAIGIEDRVYILPPSLFNEYAQFLDPLLFVPRDIDGCDGFSDTRTGVVGILKTPKLWKTAPRRDKVHYLKYVPYPRKQFVIDSFLSVLGHELVHQFHAEGLPFGFQEMGTEAYRIDVMMKLGVCIDRLRIFPDILLDPYYKTYSRYGPALHRYFFSGHSYIDERLMLTDWQRNCL